MNTPDDKILPAGQVLARGAARLLSGYGFSSVEELVPARGLRVDLMGLGGQGDIWIIECKSSRADFQSDGKWAGYLEWCDRFFWAVTADFPTELLPEDTGLIIADGYGGEIIRMGDESRLSAARRKRVTRIFAHTAARRLQRLCDPNIHMG